MKKIILAITGASAAPVGIRLMEALGQNSGVELSLVVSANALATLRLETGINFGQSLEEIRAAVHDNFSSARPIQVYDAGDMGAPIASGSHKADAMIIAPCSMSTLGAVASGITMNLIHRAASVMLKEKRTLILVPRESPLSPIHLKNMWDLCRIGVHIVPATLAFYTGPVKVADLVDFVCARVLDLARIEHRLSKRWEGKAPDEFHPRIQGYLG